MHLRFRESYSFSMCVGKVRLQLNIFIIEASRQAVNHIVLVLTGKVYYLSGEMVSFCRNVLSKKK